ncbi:MAG: SLBB domain-containing protein [Deltaproteobacteria bacterium]|nr:SLBB domain-containing protein [Candidatus Desulfobacula maris]MBL6993448.1 SLBB domain-containing protein [Desulfobacula sp.]
MQCTLKKCILILFLFFLPLILTAQEYTVGEGDVLDINVYENTDLSTTVRVSSNSTIRVPLLGELSIKDLTVSQVSAKIENLLADGYLVNPQVDVFIAEHRSKKATILGQVRNPGQFEVRGKITFLEFISKAGGLTEDAGSTATIKRINESGIDNDQIVIDLEKLIKKGDTSLNLTIQGNDSIYISKAKTYYVSGEVKKPDSYKYEHELTVIKAITMAGGFSKIAAKNKVRIIRIVNGNKTVYENVNMDEPIFPDDVLVVPESFF